MSPMNYNRIRDDYYDRQQNLKLPGVGEAINFQIVIKFFKVNITTLSCSLLKCLIMHLYAYHYDQLVNLLYSVFDLC